MTHASESATPVAQYLAYCRVERRLSERTLAIYRAALAQLQSHCVANRKDVLALEPLDLRQLAARMRAQGYASTAIALHLSSWRGFFRWAGHQGLIKANPAADIKPPKKDKPLPKALSVDQAQQLADFSPQPQSHSLWFACRDRAIVELLYGCGMRVSELTGLDRLASPHSKGWLDLGGGLAFVTGKGNKSRSIPLGRKAILAVQEWLALPLPVQPSVAQVAPLFVGINGTRLTAQSIWLRLKKWARAAQLPTAVHPHVLRHSFASHLLQSSGDLRAVQDMLGHANISTTQIYTRLNFQHLSATYDAAHPRAKRSPHAG